MGEAVFQAARDGEEAELGRLIDLGGDVNWHNPKVRRRMCLAWAPASSSPLFLRSPPPRPPDTAPFPTAQLHGRRSSHPRVLAHSSHPLVP
jgi:hypothetical protein